MSSGYAALSGRVRQALEDVRRVVNRSEALQERAIKTGDDGYLDGVALNLHSFYAGVEHILEDIARSVDGVVPAGRDWHRDLLLQMSADMVAVRPAVIRQETRYCLEEYRAFRHVVRNVYAFNLSAARLYDLTAGLRPCFDDVHQDIMAFTSFLDQVSSPNDL